VTTAPRPTAALEAALRQRGLLPDPLRALPEPGPGRPWFVGALLGISGWLAGLFALGFVTLAFRPSSTAALAVLGLVLLAVAFAVFRTGEGAFTEQGALALSIAGHALLGAAVYVGTESGAATAWAVAVLNASWIAVVPARVPRILSTLIACVAAGLSMRLLLEVDHHYLRGRQEEAVPLARALLGWTAVWIPAAVGARALVATEARWMAAGLQRVLRPVLTGLLIALALASPASHPLDGLAFWETAAQRTSWLALWPLLSLAAAVWALWLAHRVRSRALMGTAIAGALLHVFHFYALLGVTLLAKSVVMIVLGLALLGLAAALRRQEAP
jgi:hypothetical protein